MTEIICTACWRHCVLGGMGYSEETIPKDSETKVLDKDGNDIRPYCVAHYEPEKK
jgi:hypothetical protein